MSFFLAWNFGIYDQVMRKNIDEESGHKILPLSFDLAQKIRQKLSRRSSNTRQLKQGRIILVEKNPFEVFSPVIRLGLGVESKVKLHWLKRIRLKLFLP